MPDEARIVLTTAGSREEADRLARALVERRLAACVSLVPGVKSIYRWKDGVDEAEEVLLLIKTSAVQTPAVEAAIKELHSYEIPEFLVIAVEHGSEPYVEWLLGAVGTSLPEL